FTPAGVKTTFAFGLHGPFGLAFNGGNLFESDTGTGTIIKISAAGVKSTFASGLNTPTGLAFDASGNLFEADQASGTIFKFTPAGGKSTFASGLNAPSGLAFEPATAQLPNISTRASVQTGPGDHSAILSDKNGTTGIGLVEVYDVSTGGFAQLTNVSTRAFVGTDQNVAIGGFITSGGNGSAQILVRGLGPTLGQPPFNVTGVLA